MSTKEEEAFHISRRMLVLRDKTIWFAPAGDPRSHEEWFESHKDGHTWMRKYVRGFFDSRGVFLYQETDGSKWDVTKQVIDAAPVVVKALHFSKMYLAIEVPDNLPLFGGMLPSAVGTLWTPKCNLGLRTGDPEILNK